MGATEVDERVDIPPEQGEVGVHPRALHPGEGFGHEAGVHTLLSGHLLHYQPDRHVRVGHGEGVGVAEVVLVLAGGVLVLGVLDGDTHLLQVITVRCRMSLARSATVNSKYEPVSRARGVWLGSASAKSKNSSSGAA